MSPESQTSAHITATTPLAPTVNAWRIYLDDQGSSPHTLKAFTADVLLLASYLPPDRSLGSVSTADINNFLHWMQTGRGVPCSPKTLSRRVTSIKAFFRWLHKNGVILIDPAEKVVQQSVLSPIPTVLTPDEVAAVLEAANRHRTAARHFAAPSQRTLRASAQCKPDARPGALVTLLLETGIKKSECLALSLNHVDLQAPAGPLLFVRYASPQHRYKERKIALSEAWVSVFHEYQAQYHLTDRLFPWSPRRLEYLLEDLGEEAGLDKHLSFDICRWTCALSDWQSGVEHEKIRQKLGVSKIQWRELRMKLERLSEQ